MSDAKFYDSNQVFASLGDRPIQKGRAEGEFVSTDYNADSTTETVGADGEVAVSRTNNETATIKFKVMQTSDSHTLLCQLYEAQKASLNGAFLSFELRDVTGLKLEHAEKCWFKKPPATAYGAVAGEREWTLGTSKLVRETV